MKYFFFSKTLFNACMLQLQLVVFKKAKEKKVQQDFVIDFFFFGFVSRTKDFDMCGF